MRGFLIGLVTGLMAALFIGITVTPAKVYPMMRQDPVPQGSPQDTVDIVPQLPAVDFTPQAIIDILIDYNFKHVTDLAPLCNCWGMTVPETRTIYLADDMSLADRREVVLHELVHALLYNKGVRSAGPLNEMQVERQAQGLYQWLFGVNQ